MSFYSIPEYQNDLKEIAEHIVGVEELRGKTVLITGANGLIASTVADALMWLNDECGWNTEVCALARTKAKIEARFREHLGKQHFHIVLQDVTAPLESLDCRLDYVIHAACSAHPMAYSKTPVEIVRANIQGTQNLLEYMTKHGGGKFLFVSSSEVYGENRSVESIRETDYGFIDILNPRSCYSESKRAAETLCASYSKEYGIETVCVRPGFIFGASITEDNSRADAQFLRKALSGEDIVMKSAGAQLRSYEYVSDASSSILSVLTRGENMNAYNIASPISSATIRAFAETIAEESGVRVVFEDPDAVEKAGYSVISRCILGAEKLCALGWEPAVTLREGVRRMIAISRAALQS